MAVFCCCPRAGAGAWGVTRQGLEDTSFVAVCAATGDSGAWERHDPPAPSHVASQWTAKRGSWAIPPSPVQGLDRWPYPGTGDDEVLSESGPPNQGDQSWRPYSGPLLKHHFPSSGLDSPNNPLSDSLLLESRQGSAPFTASAELPQPSRGFLLPTVSSRLLGRSSIPAWPLRGGRGPTYSVHLPSLESGEKPSSSRRGGLRQQRGEWGEEQGLREGPEGGTWVLLGGKL